MTSTPRLRGWIQLGGFQEREERRLSGSPRKCSIAGGVDATARGNPVYNQAKALPPKGPDSRVVMVVLDTNVLHQGGHYLRGGDWPVLVSAARLGRLQICVPEVVVLEFVAHYRSDIERATALVERGRRSLARLQPAARRRDDEEREILTVGPPTPVADIAAWVAEYERWLRSFIREHGVVLPIPEVPHHELVEAVLAGRKPFTAGEKGYRDALIWHTVAAAVGSGPVVFVTANSKDFMDSDGAGLAIDLVNDLNALDQNADDLQIVGALAGLIDELVPADVGALDQFLAVARSTEGVERLAALVERAGRVQVVDPSGVLPPSLMDYEAEGVLTVVDVVDAVARPLDDGSFAVSGAIHATSHIVGEPRSEDEAVDTRAWTVWDDWGDGYALAFEAPQRVAFEFTLSFTPPDRLSAIEVASAVLLDSSLRPAPRASRCAAPHDASTWTYASWLHRELHRLIELDADAYRWAIAERGFVSDLDSALAGLAPALDEYLAANEAKPLVHAHSTNLLADRGQLPTVVAALDLLVERMAHGQRPLFRRDLPDSGHT